jgi:hypothetical protein
MCDPSIMAIASMASGIADFMGQQNAQAKQKKSYDEWFLQQQKNRKEQNEKQEASRKLAEAARDQALQQVGAEGQKQAQSTEEDRLTNALMQQGSTLTSDPAAASNPVAGVDTSIADQYLLSGQQSGDEVFKSDLAAGINRASQEAKNRIAALAGAQSRFGSSGGLDRYVRNIFQKSGEKIDEENQYRVGDLAVYGVQQDVDPVQWSYTPGLRIG